MKKHICNICLKKFPNERALGGRLRLHMMNQYAQQKNEDSDESKDVDHQQQISSSSYSSSSEQEFISNPKRCKCLTNQDSSLPVEISFDLLQNSESETESSKSKRVRKSRISDTKAGKSNEPSWFVENESLSSISEISHDEDVAHCLMMLSRDKWINAVEDTKNEDFGVVDIATIALDVGPNSLPRPISNLASTSTLNKVRKTCGKYRCETCNKVFKSYQALGGHKSNHKRIKVNNENEEHETEKTGKKHECPICYRVFGSGQALGGHKRSHLTKAAREHLNLVKPCSRKIDLNLPAPLDDDEEMDNFVVSNADFLS